MAFYTYVLQSEFSGLYIGQTNNLINRLNRHNGGRNKYTKNKGPWKMIFSKEFISRSESLALEKQLKAWKNPEKVLAWIERQSI